MGVPADISLQDYLEIQSLAFEWAESYDTKDWDHLKRILGPEIRLDLRSVHGSLLEALSPDQYVAVIAGPKIFGNPRVRTQHLLGANHWNSPGDGTIEVLWQIRATHQRFAAEDLAEPISKGHGHGANQHTYKKIDGAWKIVGVAVGLYWAEDDLFGALNPPEVA